MYIYNQKFLVLGLAKSGFSVSKYLLQKNCSCYIYDTSLSESIKRNVETLEKLGGIVVDDNLIDEILEEIDVIVLSPGIPINHPICVKAKEKNIRIIGELDFGFMQFMPTIVAVTGTNGKTTTTSMIHSILQSANKKSALLGNIGIPVTQELENISPDTICVTEVSSFQLESSTAFIPHIACVLNIKPDHLERHYTMSNYIFLKKRILQNLKQSEYAILNFDDQAVMEFADKCRGKKLFISLKERVEGAYLLENNLYFFEDKIISKDELPLDGDHNVFNALFSITVCKLLGLSNVEIYNGLKNFKGVKYRLELVLEKDGKQIYNDSKSTNTASTISALETMKSDTVLILGGSEKGEDYDILFQKIKNSFVKHVVLTGASRYKMLRSAIKESVTDISVTGSFENAIKIACLFLKSGDNLLFSPATASFDKFSSYAERGDMFNKIIGNIFENK